MRGHCLGESILFHCNVVFRSKCFIALFAFAAVYICLPSAAVAKTIDHVRIEALLQLLELPATGSDVPPTTSVGEQSLDVSRTLVPAPAPSPSLGENKPKSSDIPSVPFALIAPDGTNCPGGMAQFNVALQGVIDVVEGYEKRIIILSASFDELDAEALEFVTSGETSCSEDRQRSHAKFLKEINKMSILENILPAENLQFCAQLTVIEYDEKITAIDQDANFADQKKREDLNNVMRSVSELDGQATVIVQRLVSLEQKRQRLVIGVQQFEDQCAAFEGVTFGADYN